MCVFVCVNQGIHLMIRLSKDLVHSTEATYAHRNVPSTVCNSMVGADERMSILLFVTLWSVLMRELSLNHADER